MSSPIRRSPWSTAVRRGAPPSIPVPSNIGGASLYFSASPKKNIDNALNTVGYDVRFFAAAELLFFAFHIRYHCRLRKLIYFPLGRRTSVETARALSQ